MQTDTLENPLDSLQLNNNNNNNSNELQDQDVDDNFELKSEKRSRLSSKDSRSSTITNSTERKKHLCNICSKIFMGLSDLRRHLRIHSGEKPYECEYCHKKFRQSISLKNHIACIHEKNNKFSCEYCDKKFPIKERLRLHLRKHTGEKPYSCTFCNKTFARGGQLKQHLPSHSGEKKHCCKQCNASFTTKSNLFNHRKKMHFKNFTQSSGKNDDKTNTCRICNKHYNTSEGLKKHSLTCHKHIKQFFCTICNKTLKGHLQQHLNVHDNIKLYDCSKCGTKFAQKSQLNVHERVHTGERPFTCKVCRQSFSHSYVLKTHYRKHTGEKPFKCSICCNDVAFAQLPHLKTHMRTIHGKDKTYMCDGCQEFFKMKCELQQHIEKCSQYKSKLDSLASSSSSSSSSASSSSSSSLLNENTNNDNEKAISDQALLTNIRLNVVIILKKISSKERLEKLGVEKRLIDNVIMTALKHAGKKYHNDSNLNEIDRLKMNIEEFLKWTLPEKIMETFKKEKQTIEEIIEHLATGYCKNEQNEEKKK